MSFHGFRQQRTLSRCSVFEKLLYNLCPTESDRAVHIDTSMSTYVVSEDVLYELQRMNGHNLFKDLLLFLDTCSLNLLLDETRAMLVTTELHDVAVNVLRREGQQPQLKHVRKSGTLSSHLRLLFARNSSSSGLRIATR